MESSLKGKSVLVAGGSSGMGMAVAAKAAALGATVHIVGRSLERLAEAKTAIDGDVVTHHADISVESDIATLAEKIQQVDHIVTTAADLTFKPFAQISDAEIESTFAAKFWGAVYLVRHFASRIPSCGNACCAIPTIRKSSSSISGSLQRPCKRSRLSTRRSRMPGIRLSRPEPLPRDRSCARRA